MKSRIKKSIHRLYSKLPSDNVMANGKGIIDEKKSAKGKVLEACCWLFDGQTSRSYEYIVKQVTELAEMEKSPYKGSDTHEDRLVNKQDYIRCLQVTHDTFEAFSDAFKMIYKEEFGTPWYRKVRSENTKVTASNSTSKKLMEKYLK